MLARIYENGSFIILDVLLLNHLWTFLWNISGLFPCGRGGAGCQTDKEGYKERHWVHCQLTVSVANPPFFVQLCDIELDPVNPFLWNIRLFPQKAQAWQHKATVSGRHLSSRFQPPLGPFKHWSSVVCGRLLASSGLSPHQLSFCTPAPACPLAGSSVTPWNNSYGSCTLFKSVWISAF